MGKGVSPETKALQDLNLETFDKWLKKNGKRLVPKPNKAVIYAGYAPTDMQKAKRLLTSDSGMVKMWQIIEAINDDVEKIEGQAKFDLLNDVLKRCRETPRLLVTTGPGIGKDVDGRIPNLLVYAELISKKEFAFVDKGKIGKIWDKLSSTYVSNSEGEVAVLEGRTPNNKRVTIGYTIVRAELESLWKRKDLPEATKQNAAKMIAGFFNYYDGQAQMSEDIVKEAREVMRKARIARKGR